MRSRIKPIQKVAKIVHRYHPLILNSFPTGRAFCSEVVKGMNDKVRVALSKAFGFRSHKSSELVLCYTVVGCRQPSLASRYC